MYMNENNFREWQKYVYQGIIDRVTRGDRSTSVVFHPRGGKSHVQRAVAITLADRGLISCGLSININRLLRDQMGDLDIKKENAIKRTQKKTRMEELFDLLQISGINTQCPPQSLAYAFEHWPDDPFSNGEMFGSATIQTLTQFAGYKGLIAFVESMAAAGKPVLIFFDECHLLEGKQTWGMLYQQLLDAGAYVVVMTGTANRTDGETIPGFWAEYLSDEEARSHHIVPAEDPGFVNVVYLEGRKRNLVQRADIEVPLWHGWNPPPGEKPSLCQIDRKTFDPKVSIFEARETVYEDLLSEAPRRHFRRALRASLRNPIVIAAAVEILVDRLQELRKKYPKVKGIVFTGNDEREKGSQAKEDNKHGKLVEREIRKLMPDWRCLIATSVGDDDMSSTLADKVSGFNDSAYDILIVKQAAGVGLDAPSIKVGLDLSTTRTFAQCVQRALRVATPYEDLMLAYWITPDDPLWLNIWSQAIDKNQGSGVSTKTEMEEVGRELREKEEIDNEVFVDVTGVIDGPTYDNNGGFAGVGDEKASEWLVKHYPLFRGRFTTPELVQIVSSGIINKPIEQPQEIARDAGIPNEIKASQLRALMNQTVKKIIRNELGGGVIPQEIYKPCVVRAWNQAKDEAGAGRVDLDKITSISKLESIYEALKRIEMESRPYGQNTEEETYDDNQDVIDSDDGYWANSATGSKYKDTWPGDGLGWEF